jgi:UDP-GlcNAc:undecaprenyl-phosphate GlcNAc-1-phosphate transferase
MIFSIFTVLASFLVSLAAVALVLWLSHKKSWYDTINERKIHSGDVPRLGGIGFAFPFIIAAFIIVFSAPEPYMGMRFLPPLISMLLILGCGIFDDFRPLAPRRKLLLQVIAALCVILPDYTFQQFVFLGQGKPWELNWLRYPLSFLWLVGLTNAMNFIDGVDGLAGGLAVLITLSYALIFMYFFNVGSVTLLCFCLISVIGGFLVFNLPIPKAKIFMGDGGSQFLGFMVALLPLINQGNTRSNLPLLYAAALLIIPILDTTAAVWRRIRDGRRIDSPDKSHIHHKLMNLGFQSRGVVAVLYGLQILLGGLVFISVKLQGVPSIIMLGGAYLAGIAFFIIFHFMNRAQAKRRKVQEPLEVCCASRIKPYKNSLS